MLKIKRGGFGRLLSAMLATLLLLGGLPAFAADGDAVSKITPQLRVIGSPDLIEGELLTKLAFKAYEPDMQTEIDGSFAWDASANSSTVPPVGTHQFTVNFAPTDDTRYFAASKSFTVTVRPLNPLPPSPTTAEQVNIAVRDLSESASTAEINALAEALRRCSSQNRLWESTMIKLGNLYKRANGYSESVRVYSGDFSYSSRLPEDASEVYGAALSVGGNAAVYIDQKKASGNAELQFELSTGSGARLSSPVVVSLGLPNNWNNSRDYYLRGGSGSPSVSIRRPSGGDRYYATFLADSTGTYRLIRESNRNDNDDDDYEMTSFWEDVIDDIGRAGRDGRVRVSVGTRTTMPAEVLRELEGRSVTLVLRRSNGETISIYGREVRSVPSDRDYYTMSALASRYDSARASSSAIGAPRPAPVPIPPPPVPVPPAPPPVYLPPAAPAVVKPAPAPSSSAAASSSSAPEEPFEDIEVVAEEDEPAEESVPAESSKPQESTGGTPADPMLFGLFTVTVLLLAALVAGGLTFAVWSRRKRFL